MVPKNPKLGGKPSLIEVLCLICLALAIFAIGVSPNHKIREPKAPLPLAEVEYEQPADPPVATSSFTPLPLSESVDTTVSLKKWPKLANAGFRTDGFSTVQTQTK